MCKKCNRFFIANFSVNTKRKKGGEKALFLIALKEKKRMYFFWVAQKLPCKSHSSPKPNTPPPSILSEQRSEIWDFDPKFYTVVGKDSRAPILTLSRTSAPTHYSLPTTSYPYFYTHTSISTSCFYFYPTRNTSYLYQLVPTGYILLTIFYRLLLTDYSLLPPPPLHLFLLHKVCVYKNRMLYACYW